MDTYPHMLRVACDAWLRQHYADQYQVAFYNRKVAPRTENVPPQMREELPEMHLPLAVGPWKRLYVWFKSPGALLSASEKENLNCLRSQGYRVAIVRHPEDFKTLIRTLLNPVE